MSLRPRVLGIDPGTRVIGFALLEAKCERPRVPRDWSIADVGILRTKAELSMAVRLGEIHNALFALTKELAPTLVGIEKAFHGVNAGTAIKLGEARGALISAISRHGVTIQEITPAQVKRLIAGHGAADKNQVYQALQGLLKFDRGHLPLDASDALAIAMSVTLTSDIFAPKLAEQKPYGVRALSF